MDIKLDKTALVGEIDSISSKSYAHRMILAASLAENPSQIVCKCLSDDICTTIDCANKLGASITIDGDTLTVNPIKKYVENKHVDLNCNECGSVLRFILPITSALGREATISGKGRLPMRPLGEIIEVMRARGVNFSSDRLPLTINGQLTSGRFEIAAGVSSQYITALLMALPLLKGNSEIVLLGDLKSKGYVDITIEVLRIYGIIVLRTPNGYMIKGNQKYIAPPNIAVEGDWSNAAFPLVGGLLCGDVCVKNLNPFSSQGDKEIIKILTDMNGNIQSKKSANHAFSTDFRAVKSELSPITVDISDIPDAAPILSVACAAAMGTSTLIGVERLRAKECDRLEAIIEMLSTVGIKTEYSLDKLVIHGDISILSDGSEPIVLSSYNDHRMAMSAGIIAALRGNVTITGIESVDKSYPTFWQELNKLSR